MSIENGLNKINPLLIKPKKNYLYLEDMNLPHHASSPVDAYSMCKYFPYTPRILRLNNLQIIQQLYDAFHDNDAAAIRQLFHPNIEWVQMALRAMVGT